jgi:hypothetical protein
MERRKIEQRRPQRERGIDQRFPPVGFGNHRTSIIGSVPD